jgi:hypothetical protein
MGAIDIINIIIALVAIIISIGAIILSLKWNKESERNLSEAKNILKSIEKTSDSIERNVSDKMDDILKRSFPSQKETVETQAMDNFFTGILNGQLDIDNLSKIADLADKFTPKEGK